MRRATVVGEGLGDRFNEREIGVVHRYETMLTDTDLIDFDGMIHEAVRLARDHPIVVELTAARFPWLLVDE
jgi:superfamily I DNA/RNA helicase